MQSRLTTPIPGRTPSDVFAAAQTVGVNPPKGFSVTLIDPAYLRVTMRCPMSMVSWGENITIQVLADPQGAVLDIHSKSVYPLQWIDFGKCQKNVETLTQAVLYFLGQYR